MLSMILKNKTQNTKNPSSYYTKNPMITGINIVIFVLNNISSTDDRILMAVRRPQ